MTPEHDQWDEFIEELSGPAGCDFRKDASGKTLWTCHGGNDKRLAEHILAEMGFDLDEIAASCLYFEDNGGFCDCEIVFNVDVVIDEP